MKIYAKFHRWNTQRKALFDVIMKIYAKFHRWNTPALFGPIREIYAKFHRWNTQRKALFDKRTHALALSCAVITLILVFALPSTEQTESANIETSQQLTLPPLASAQNTEEQNDWRTATVQPGDNLSIIFARLGLNSEDLYTLLSSSPEAKTLEQLQPGEIFKIRTNDQGALLELIHETDNTQSIRAIRKGDGFTLSQYTREIEKRTVFSAGVIKSSFYQSALDADLSDAVIIALVEIFGWDIDFALDIQPGDSFTVLYQEHHIDGKKQGDGPILAAEFTNRSKTHRAVRYQHPNGKVHYLTPEGRSLKQSFLRSPVDFRRISSHFQSSRWHPVLGRKRPHRGTDYAAATGTPIKAAGDGVVRFIGRKGGYGNTIILKHGNRHTTLYGHMSRFKKGLRRGQQVEQGQIIGYVGQTGLATGPHLHYEFRIKGKHVDPVTVALPKAILEPRYMADFRRQTDRLIAQLETYNRIRLAFNTQE